MSGFAFESETISRISFVVYDSIYAKRLLKNKSLKANKISGSSESFSKSCALKVNPLFNETVKAMKLSLANFIYNISYACFVEESSLIISLIYLDRIISKQKVLLNNESLYQVVVGCVIAAVKYNQDYHCLSMMQSVTAIQPQHLSNIETWALESLSYSLYVDQTIYETYAFHLASLKLSI